MNKKAAIGGIVIVAIAVIVIAGASSGGSNIDMILMTSNCDALDKLSPSEIPKDRQDDVKKLFNKCLKEALGQ